MNKFLLGNQYWDHGLKMYIQRPIPKPGKPNEYSPYTGESKKISRPK